MLVNSQPTFSLFHTKMKTLCCVGPFKFVLGSFMAFFEVNVSHLNDLKTSLKVNMENEEVATIFYLPRINQVHRRALKIIFGKHRTL